MSDTKFRVSIEVSQHPHPESLIDLVAHRVLGQLQQAESDLQKAEERFSVAENTKSQTLENMRGYGVDRHTIDAEISSLKEHLDSSSL